ncbi:hypothetical protein V8C35DRAFT_298385 [Trichoderma chlorosporum]
MRWALVLRMQYNLYIVSKMLAQGVMAWRFAVRARGGCRGGWRFWKDGSTGCMTFFFWRCWFLLLCALRCAAMRCDGCRQERQCCSTRAGGFLFLCLLSPPFFLELLFSPSCPGSAEHEYAQ